MMVTVKAKAEKVKEKLSQDQVLDLMILWEEGHRVEAARQLSFKMLPLQFLVSETMLILHTLYDELS